MRVAIVYDRLNKVGGAESVLLAFHKIFPQAEWYTSFWNPKTAPFSRSWRVHHFPYLSHHHEWFPWLMPFIFEAYDFGSYDLVISIGSAECKGVITKPGTFHLHYCLTPTRYLYSHADEYLNNPLYRWVAKYLRKWDQVASKRPDKMIAISTQVKKRIKKYYNCDAPVIFPPVDTARFSKSSQLATANYQLPGGYFLVVSRLVPYKKIDLIIRAFNVRPSLPLVIIGTGNEIARLKRLALHNTTFLNFVKDSELPTYYQNARAYVQINEEDFGISMVEAQAAGVPVLSFRRGGASDIVINGITGILLECSSVQSLVSAVDNFCQMSFDKEACISNAARFDTSVWQAKFKQYLIDYGY